MNSKIEPILASVLVYFPIAWVSALGGYLGRRNARQGIKLRRKWVARMHHNLEELQGIKQQSVREQMIVRHIEHIGRIYAEYPIVHRLAKAGRFNIEGAQHLKTSDKPTLFVTAHTGHWELLAEVMIQHKIPVAYIYDPIENSLRLKVAMRTRRKICPEEEGYKYIGASKTAGKEVVHWLKDGGNLFIFGDEEVDSIIWAPDFGRDLPYSGNLAKTIKLATKYNMQIIPLHVKRTANARYTAVIEAPIAPPSATASPAAIKELYSSLNAVIEKWVLEDICHWYWLANLDLKRKP